VQKRNRKIEIKTETSRLTRLLDCSNNSPSPLNVIASRTYTIKLF